MPQYSLTGFALPGVVVGGAPASALALLEIIAGPTDSPVITRIELAFICGSAGATATDLGLGYPAAQGVSPQAPVLTPSVYDPNNAPTAVSVATAWRIAPTPPTKYLRRAQAIPTVGASTAMFAWNFPRGLKLAPSSSLVVYNVAPIAAHTMGCDFNVEWDV